jgi:RNA polymerase sigma-70 factor (ECF subfamily)
MIPSVAEPMQQPQPSDHAVNAARAGDPGGFDELFRTFAGPIASFARTRGAADPEGICNEAFLRAFRGIPTFTGDGAAFRRWLFSITRNLLIDAHRASQRRPDEVFAPPPERAVPGADELAVANIADAELRSLLAVLTDEQREVIVLRLVADLSLADTAEIVGRPVSAVKRLQARALRRLQTEILDRGVSR